MIIATSALFVILFDEPDGPALLQRLAEASIRLMSSANTVVMTSRMSTARGRSSGLAGAGYMAARGAIARLSGPSETVYEV